MDTSDKISNILGTQIPLWVIDQLDTRSQQNSRNSRDNDNIVYLANKSAWVRLVSSVNIPETDMNYFKKEVIEGDNSLNNSIDVKNPQSLAEQFVLFGGTSKYLQNNSYGLRSGLGVDGAYGTLGNKETQNYGYKPMPGITGVNIETQGKLGSVRAATINFKCWDKNQLDIMDVLYFKLGFSMFLEWGHTFYYKDKNSTKIQSSELNSIDPFKSGLDKEQIFYQIGQNSRESQGNYSAMLGIVTNFNFSYNQEGGYDCTVKLMSLGVLGDSIKINNPGVLPGILKQEIINLNNTLTRLNTPKVTTPPGGGTGTTDEQKKIDLKEKSILATINTQMYKDRIKEDPNKATPGKEGGYPDETELYAIKANAGILNSAFDKATAATENYDFIYDLSGNLGYTLFSTRYGVSLPTNSTSTYIDNITLDQNKLKDKINSVFFTQPQGNAQNNNLPGSVQNLNTNYIKPNIEDLVAANSQPRPDFVGVGDTNKWETEVFTYPGKNGKKYIIKILVDLPDDTEYGYDPNTSLQYAISFAGAKTGFYPNTREDLYKETIKYILNSGVDANNKASDTVFKIADGSGINVGRSVDVFNNTGLYSSNKQFMYVKQLNSNITAADINSTPATTNNPPNTYIFSLKGTYTPTLKIFGSTTNTTKTSTTVTTGFIDGPSYNPVNYTILIGDTDLISDMQPNKSDPNLLYSEYTSKIVAQNQTQNNAAAAAAAAAAEEERKAKLKALSEAIDSATQYQSALEIILRTIEVHSLNKALGKGLNIGGSVVTLPLYDKGDKIGDKTFLHQIFSNGVMSGFIDELISGSISNEDYGKTSDGTFKINTKYGYASSLMANTAKIDDIKPVVYTELLKSYTIPYNISADIVPGVSVNHPVYIPFGLLLMIINNICTIYDTKKSSGEQTPLLYIDFNPELNFCLSSNKQLSTNPWVTLIPFQGTDQDYKTLFNESVLSGDSIKATAGSPASKLFTTAKDGVSGQIPTFKADSSYRGKIMNILLNLDYVCNTIRQFSTKDSENKVYLKPFLEQVLSDLNKFLGNFNIFRLSYNDNANTLQIVDDQILPPLDIEKLLPTDNTTHIPLLGKTSIAKTLEIKSEVSSKLSNLLAISANPEWKDKAGLSVNGDSVGYINESYFDRYITNRQEVSSSKNSSLDTAILSATKFNSAITDFYGSYNPVEANVSHATNYYIDKITNVKNDDYPTRAAAMIPVSVNFTTDGIGGLNMMQAFTIPQELLPYTYATRKTPSLPKDHINKVGFVIVGLSHTIENNIWNTAVRANMIFLKDKDEFTGTAAIPDRALKAFTYNANNGGVGVMTTSDGPCIEPYIPNNLNKGWEGKKQPKMSTIVDPVVEGPKLVQKYGKTVAHMMLASMLQEQNFKGYNYNIGGFDITAGGWTFNDKYHNGYVVIPEGTTKLCKAFISFINFDAYFEFKNTSAKRKGFDKITNADEFAELYYKSWLGGDSATLKAFNEYPKIAKVNGGLYDTLEDYRKSSKASFKSVYNQVEKYL